MNKLSIPLLCCLFFAAPAFSNNQNEKPILEIQSTAAIISLDYSPDGEKIVTGGQTNEITVWNVKNGASLMNLKGHTDNVVAVKFSPNGRYIASGGVDNKLIVWDAISGDLLHKHAAHRDYVRDVAFSPDNKWVASASWDGTSMVWNVLTGEVVATLTAHLDNVTSVDFNADGSEMLTGSGDKTIRAWDTKTWTQKYMLQGHTDEVWDTHFSSNGRMVAGGAWDNKARVWDVAQRTQIHVFTAHTSDVWSVGFSPDNQLLVSGSGDRQLKVWDLATGELAADLAKDLFKAEIECVSFSPDGKFVAAASRDGFLRIFKTPSVSDRKNAFVNQKITKWSVKDQFEKTDDYQSRLRKTDRQKEQYAEEFDKKASDFFLKYSGWEKLTLGDYNADDESFAVTSPYLGKLRVVVAAREAKNFKEIFNEKFKDMKIKAPRFAINQHIELQDAELTVPDGKEFRYYYLRPEKSK